jgi:hypothetical protein
VNYSLLYSWLGLPLGTWPPNHYALIGIAPGVYDPAEIERIVLSRMDRLRPHQLLHPELVTEGMNRLAQALICLTDPATRLAYDAEIGLAATPSSLATSDKLPGQPTVVPRFTASGPSPTHSSINADGEKPSLPTYPRYEILPGFPLTPEEADSEPADATKVIVSPILAQFNPPEPLPPAYEVVEPEPLPPAYELVPDEVEWRPGVSPPEWAIEIVEPQRVTIRSPSAWQPATPRDLYRRLVYLRRLLTAFRKFKSSLGNPYEPFDHPGELLKLLDALGEIRPLLASNVQIPWGADTPHEQVIALIKQPHILHTVRLLLPEQREAIAFDLKRIEQFLLSENRRLRKLARLHRKLRFRGTQQWRAVWWVARIPEVIWVVLAFFVALAVLTNFGVAR